MAEYESHGREGDDDDNEQMLEIKRDYNLRFFCLLGQLKFWMIKKYIIW